MKIFLSSTAYDLGDIRKFVVDKLSKMGHEVIHHEIPTFVQPDLHSHDQCIAAVKECDIVLCIIDKRYGGRYSGNLKFEDQIIPIRGYDPNSDMPISEIKVKSSKLSITWCELITAYENDIPVITFARKRLLDEKDTRRKNQFLDAFIPAYAEKNELFDLVDWITKQKTSNWVASFNDMGEFEKNLIKWADKLENHVHTCDIKIPKKDLSKLCIVVEGEIDRIFVNYLIDELRLQNYFVVIPSYGKYRTLNYFESTILEYATIFDQVIVLMDSDTQSWDEIEYIRNEFTNRIEESGLKNISFHLAAPEIESWIAAGLDKDIYLEFDGNIDKKRFNKVFTKSTKNNISNILKKDFNFWQAMGINYNFHMFVEELMAVGKKQESESKLNEDTTSLKIVKRG